MARPIHVLLRKSKTLVLTLQRCSNWPSVVLAKVGLLDGPEVIRLRDGFQLEVMQPMKSTWGEIFEPAIADVYGIARNAFDLIIDVGANIGAFTCYAAFLHRGAAVHAFEPSQKHATLLRKNVALNRLENVIFHDQPVTKDGRDVTFSHRGHGGASGIFLHDNRDSPVVLKSVSLGQVGFARFQSAFIKLDCEGAEGEIIEWVCQNVSRLPPRIRLACEYHPWCPVPLDQALSNLRASGFVANERILFDECYLFASLDPGRAVNPE